LIRWQRSAHDESGTAFCARARLGSAVEGRVRDTTARKPGNCRRRTSLRALSCSESARPSEKLPQRSGLRTLFEPFAAQLADSPPRRPNTSHAFTASSCAAVMVRSTRSRTYRILKLTPAPALQGTTQRAAMFEFIPALQRFFRARIPARIRDV